VLSGSFLASFGVAGTSQAWSYTAALALASGLVLVVAGFLRIGWVAEFLSKPIVTGFVLGLTILVIVNEIPHLLGVPTPQGQVVSRIGALGQSLTRGDADTSTVLVSAGSLLLLFGGARLVPKVPWGLVVLVAGLVVSGGADLAAKGVEVVGTVPRGLPTPTIPAVEPGDLPALLSAGAALAMVGLAEGLSAARLFAGRGGYRVDADQELLAAGVANVASGLFAGLGVAGSLSKTAAASDARARSQITGVVAAALSLVVIVALAPALSSLPRAVLSAIVINAVWKLMDFGALRRYAHVRRNDIVAAIVAAVGVIWFGPLNGLLIAVATSVLGLIYRSSRLQIDTMGRVPGEKAAWGSMSRHGERPTYPGVLVLRIDTPIFWVTAAPVLDAVVDRVDATPGIRAVVLDLEATNQIDVTSLDALAEILHSLRDRNVDLYLVRVMAPVRRALQRSGLMAEIGEDHLWHSISQGVREARGSHDLGAYPAIPGGVFDSDWLPGVDEALLADPAMADPVKEVDEGEERIVPRQGGLEREGEE
jgi:anti-anti-sigma factor